MSEAMSEALVLEPEVKTWLLTLARQSIACHLRGAPLAELADVPAAAQSPGGCFVTLHQLTGALRGCIGTFSDGEPLWHNVREMAIAAATRDPRFPGMTPDELPGCKLEISVLSPAFPARAEDVQVGVHGINLRLAHRRGLLLPQVAVSHGWDRVTFLSQTCVKAGLPTDAWRRPDAVIELFTAAVFGEV